MAEDVLTIDNYLAWFLESYDAMLTANLERFKRFEECKKGPFEETRDEYWRVTIDIEAGLNNLCKHAEPLPLLLSKMSADDVVPGWRDDVIRLLRQNLDALMDLLFLRPWPRVPFDYAAGITAEKYTRVVDRVTESRAALVQRLVQLLDWLDAQGKTEGPKACLTPPVSRDDRRIAREIKIVAALRAHHGYDTESYRHTPMSGAELSRQTGFSPATVSRWFKQKMPNEGYEGYERICAANGVHKWLESLSGETSFGTLGDMDDFANDDE